MGLHPEGERRLMIRRSLSWLVLMLLTAALAFTGACGGTQAPSASSMPPDDAAPYPFTSSEIRGGCPQGRVVEYRFEKEGAPSRGERWAFAPIGDDRVAITTTPLDAEGSPAGAPETETAKWTELHEHARFPRAATTIAEESVTVPAGTFAALRYSVAGGKDAKTVWFAKSLPGPPIKMQVEHGPQIVLTMTMQSNRMQ
jgi:hypothetical protein